MAWVRIDDQAPRNEKMLKAGPAACWLWVCGIAHCQSQLTDGFISDHVLAMIGVKGVPRCKRLATQLVSAGLFERTQKGSQNGYLVHDYLAFNDTAAVARAYKRQVYETKARAGRAGGLNRRIGTVERREPEEADAKQTPSTQHKHLLSRTEADGKQTEQPSAKPHPIPSQKKESKERSLEPPKEPADPNVRLFLQWFPSEYKTRRHEADYLVKWEKDAPLVKTLLKATTYERLQQCARILLSDKCEDDFIIASDRGIGVLSAKFNWLSDKLASWEARQKASAS